MMENILKLLQDGPKSGMEITNLLKNKSNTSYQIQREIRILFQKRIIDITDDLKYKMYDTINPTIEIC